jgi:hypothetical protein
MPILPSRPSWLLQYLASSQIRCPGNVKAIRSPCSKSRIVQGGGKRRSDHGGGKPCAASAYWAGADWVRWPSLRAGRTKAGDKSG